MSFNMEDVMEIVKIVKECKDSELHIDTGDIKLSLFKGDVGDTSKNPIAFSGATAVGASKPAVETAPEALDVPSADASDQSAAEVCIVPPVETAPEAIDEEGLAPVKANVTSVFYRKPSPEEPPFVEVGDPVEPDTVVCLLEVMKCFRQVTADTKGVVAKICAESNNLVEQGSTLFLIRPE